MPRSDIHLSGIQTRFQPGNRANPGGKPAGVRNRLQGDFLKALADDFAEHGAAVIAACRESKPADYLRIVASLMPALDATRSFDGLSDEELDTAMLALRAMIADAERTG